MHRDDEAKTGQMIATKAKSFGQFLGGLLVIHLIGATVFVWFNNSVHKEVPAMGSDAYRECINRSAYTELFWAMFLKDALVGASEQDRATRFTVKDCREQAAADS